MHTHDAVCSGACDFCPPVRFGLTKRPMLGRMLRARAGCRRRRRRRPLWWWCCTGAGCVRPVLPPCWPLLLLWRCQPCQDQRWLGLAAAVQGGKVCARPSPAALAQCSGRASRLQGVSSDSTTKNVKGSWRQHVSSLLGLHARVYECTHWVMIPSFRTFSLQGFPGQGCCSWLGGNPCSTYSCGWPSHITAQAHVRACRQSVQLP